MDKDEYGDKTIDKGSKRSGVLGVHGVCDCHGTGCMGDEADPAGFIYDHYQHVENVVDIANR